MLPEAEIEPVDGRAGVADAARGGRPARPGGRDQAQRRARHEHGHDPAKSLLEVKDGLTFLDVIARQVPRCASARGAEVPLVLMNSFATRDDSLERAEAHPELEARRAARLRPEQGAEAARRRT